MRKLRAGSPKIVVKVVYQQLLLDCMKPLGVLSSGRGVVFEGLRMGEWEKQLRGLERISKAAAGI